MTFCTGNPEEKSPVLGLSLLETQDGDCLSRMRVLGFKCPGQCKSSIVLSVKKTLIAYLLSRPYFRLWDIAVKKIDKVFSLMKLTGKANFKK